MDTRKTVTVYYGTFTAGTITRHNNNHAHTLRESCTICTRLGTVWVREGMPEVTKEYTG